MLKRTSSQAKGPPAKILEWLLVEGSNRGLWTVYLLPSTKNQKIVGQFGIEECVHIKTREEWAGVEWSGVTDHEKQFTLFIFKCPGFIRFLLGMVALGNGSMGNGRIHFWSKGVTCFCSLLSKTNKETTPSAPKMKHFTLQSTIWFWFGKYSCHTTNDISYLLRTNQSPNSKSLDTNLTLDSHCTTNQY